jgi:hypothetical protein
MAIYGSLGEVNVGALSATTSDNAVDVFVYDTRKDSDGGQWRKRTQHTSWYNETLNTATRGSRRDFPAVAVIVATADNVTIYDGDDPDMPMWMVFTNSGAVVLNWGTNGSCTPTSIFCINGILSIGKTVSGCLLFNFVKDDIRLAYMTNPYSLTTGRLITDRNNSNSGGYTTTGDGYIIANNVINDVAMTVLPNAPIDSATGLPVPTIAIATSAGVSVIRDDGIVQNTDVAIIIKLGFIKGDRLAYGHRGGFAYQGIALNVSPFRNSATYGWFLNSEVPSLGGNIASDSPGAVLGVGDGNIYFYGGSTGGIRRVSENEQSKVNGMTNYITTSYNTGWMHGDIKGAWLSDTSTASVTGTELVTNGTFDSNTTGWTVSSSSTISVVSGALRMNANGNAYGGVRQNLTLEVGKIYVATFDVGTITNAISFFAIIRTNAGSNLTTSLVTANTKNTLYFIATEATGTYILFESNNNTSAIFDIDNVSVRLAEPDRSVNNKGLAVYGTITKSAVATGSNLVAYSGWSTTNYLQQPYNSSIALGATDSLCIMAWTKQSTTPQYAVIYATGETTNGRGRYLYLYTGIPQLDTYGGAGNQGTRSIADGAWHHVVGIYTPQGGSIYVDGQLYSTPTWTLGYLSQTGTSYYSRVGTDLLAGANTVHPGSIALLRVSNSVPSPEQIKKIYEDEKVLFQPNSQCTLFGASDWVTAIAYDDTTKLLSVGTSSGRSDFQGLERINNTTTAVTTAISASNGLIAEQ